MKHANNHLWVELEGGATTTTEDARKFARHLIQKESRSGRYVVKAKTEDRNGNIDISCDKIGSTMQIAFQTSQSKAYSIELGDILFVEFTETKIDLYKENKGGGHGISGG